MVPRREDRKPEGGPLALTEPQPQPCLLAVHGDPQRQRHSFRLPCPLLPRFHKQRVA